MNEQPHRKYPAHPPIVADHDRSVIVFVTACTAHRARILDRPEIHGILRAAWHVADRWVVGKYVVMPDHIHLFCAPSAMDCELSDWMRFWKSSTARIWPFPDEAPVWQRSYWDTTLRRRDNYLSKWEYVSANPVRAGLCAYPEEWPYQGEMNTLMWR